MLMMLGPRPFTPCKSRLPPPNPPSSRQLIHCSAHGQARFPSSDTPRNSNAPSSYTVPDDTINTSCKQLAANLDASTTAYGMRVGVSYSDVPCRTIGSGFSSRVNQGKMVSGHYDPQILQQQPSNTDQWKRNPMQSTRRARGMTIATVKLHNFPALQMQYLWRKASQCRSLNQGQHRIVQCKLQTIPDNSLHKLQRQTVCTTYRPIQFAPEPLSSCRQTSRDQSLAQSWEEHRGQSGTQGADQQARSKSRCVISCPAPHWSSVASRSISLVNSKAGLRSNMFQ